ncbi:TIGR00304 family protein [Archaeoglobales archaeon]|nr:MAG: TIGR00304 family protein [Archaeoglobales archaeon]
MNPFKIMIGIVLIFMGMSMLLISQSNVEYGGIVIIGPIPIVFGSSPDMAIFSIVIAAILLILAYTFMR